MIHFHERYPEAAGILPEFFDPADPRPAKAQFNDAYSHGGGWHDFQGFKLRNWEAQDEASIVYTGDPPMRELARGKLREETLILFEGEWLAIVQPDGSFAISRAD
jgi:hypothetical protein